MYLDTDSMQRYTEERTHYLARVYAEAQYDQAWLAGKLSAWLTRAAGWLESQSKNLPQPTRPTATRAR